MAIGLSVVARSSNRRLRFYVRAVATREGHAKSLATFLDMWHRGREFTGGGKPL